MIPKNVILNKYKCGICNLVKKNGVKEKFRISERSAAEQILRVAKAKQDSVLVRFADIQTPERLLAADIYCHKDCKRDYVRDDPAQSFQCVFCEEELNKLYQKEIDEAMVKNILELAAVNGDEELTEFILKIYDRDTDTLQSPIYSHAHCRNAYLDPDAPEMVQILTKYVDPLIKDMLNRGYFLALTDIREHVKENCPRLTLHNYQIKSYLFSEFKNELKFAQPHQMKKAMIAYPADISSDQLVARIEHFERSKQVGQMIRKKLLEVDFGLTDKFCDSANLKDSWENTRMPETLIEFFSGLLNMSKADLVRASGMDSSTQEFQDALLNKCADNEDEESSESEDESSDDETVSAEIIDETESQSREDNLTAPSGSTSSKYQKRKKPKRKPKVLLAQSLFQTMYTAIYRGKKRAPQQVMAAFYIHDRSKSKTMMTCFHHLGYCMSYSEYKREQALMGAIHV